MTPPFTVWTETSASCSPLLERLKPERPTIMIFQSDHGYSIGNHGVHTKSMAMPSSAA
jgi:hypothetical protein